MSAVAPRPYPAIFPAAQAADEMAEHLSPSWKRTGRIDVVNRQEVEAALLALDRMFAIEAQRFAYFHEDANEFDDNGHVMVGCGLNDQLSQAIVTLFSAKNISVISSFLNMDNEALAESLEFGLSSIEWDDEGRGDRALIIDAAGGKLPAAYLTHAFRRASSRLQGLLEHRVGLTRLQAQIATREIRRSVIIETVRAGANASERLETLASWVLTLEDIDMPFITRLLARGSYLFMLALLATASGIPESKIRDSVWSDECDSLIAACKNIGLVEADATFIRSAILEAKRFGRIGTASQLADFCAHMGFWLGSKADEEQTPIDVIEATLLISDWIDWAPNIEGQQPATGARTADIIRFPVQQ